MKKLLKNRLFIFIVTAITFGSIGVYAGNLSADEIIYNSSDGNKTVQTAINELYPLKFIGDATAADIAEGKTAIVQGKEVTGTAKSKSNFTINITSGAMVQSNSNNFVPSGGQSSVSTQIVCNDGVCNFSKKSNASNFNPDSVSNSGSFRVTSSIDSVSVTFN